MHKELEKYHIEYLKLLNKWDDVFKSSFEELDNLDRSILVGLVENKGGYKFQ